MNYLCLLLGFWYECLRIVRVRVFTKPALFCTDIIRTTVWTCLWSFGRCSVDQMWWKCAVSTFNVYEIATGGQCTIPNGTCTQPDAAPIVYAGENTMQATGGAVRSWQCRLRIGSPAPLDACAQVGIQNNGNGTYTIVRAAVDSCSNACLALSGFLYAHCWENAAQNDLPPNSLALWDFVTNEPPPLPDYTSENGRCLRTPKLRLLFCCCCLFHSHSRTAHQSCASIALH